MTQYSFDLRDSPWLPVQELDGRLRTVSLREALARAHELRSLSDPSPLVTLSLHRLLLAIVHRAVDGPSSLGEWKALWTADRLPVEAINGYLDSQADRFDLFHPEYPFLQVGGLMTLSGGDPSTPSPASRLQAAAASGNNHTMFNHSFDQYPTTLSSSNAAKFLIATLGHSASGGQGGTSNLFGKHPYSKVSAHFKGISVLVLGNSLHQTLIANLNIYNQDEPIPNRGLDLPAWERNSHRAPGEAQPTGYLDFLTFQSRYLRLIPSGALTDPVVRQVWFSSGLALPAKEYLRNPLWVYTRPDSSDSPEPVKLRPDRAVWRDSSAILVPPSPGSTVDDRPAALRRMGNPRLRSVLPDRTRLRLACFGLAYDPSNVAKFLTWREEHQPSSIAMLASPEQAALVADAVEVAEKAAKHLRSALRLVSKLSLDTDQKPAHKDDIRRLTTRMWARSGYWADLDMSFTEFIAAVAEEESEAAFRRWIEHLLQTAEAAFRRSVQAAQGPLSRRLRAEALGERELRNNLFTLRTSLLRPQEESPS